MKNEIADAEKTLRENGSDTELAALVHLRLGKLKGELSQLTGVQQSSNAAPAPRSEGQIKAEIDGLTKAMANAAPEDKALLHLNRSKLYKELADVGGRPSGWVK